MTLEQAMLLIAEVASFQLGTALTDMNSPAVRHSAATRAQLLIRGIYDQDHAHWMLDTEWTAEFMRNYFIEDTITPAMTVLANSRRTEVEELLSTCKGTKP